MLAILDRLTHQVAIALASTEIRDEVYGALLASPYREHKIHFRRFLFSEGEYAGMPGRLGTAMRAGTPGGLAGLKVALDSLVDVEFYLPVPDHQRIWQGQPDLVVATAIRDHQIPVGYRVGGEPFIFESSEVPPPVPVLAIVPLEGLVRRNVGPQATHCDPTALVECEEDGGGGFTPLLVPTQSGLWMNHSVIPGDYEGFLMGNPEFEVVLASRTQSSGDFNKEIQCAGQHAKELGTNQPGIKAPEFVFDQNGEDWRGLVQIGTVAQLQEAQSSDSASMLMIWEDDNEACRIRKGEASVLDFIKAVAAAVTGKQAFVKAKNDPNDNTILSAVLAAAGLASNLITLLGNLQSDDVVGMMVHADRVGLSFTDATHVLLRGGDIQGRVNLVLKP